VLLAWNRQVMDTIVPMVVLVGPEEAVTCLCFRA
jgi:hypothetical protein